MKRKIWTKKELSEVFKINDKGELERLNDKYSPKGEGWTVVECKCNTNEGYCCVRFKGSMIRYHAIIWILTHGTIEDADAELDHINGDKLDNRIENLRLVSNRENSQNKTQHRNGKLVGACLHKCGKWSARIKINGKQINLGYYDTEQEAHNVYCKALELIGQYVDNKQFRNLLKKQRGANE